MSFTVCMTTGETPLVIGPRSSTVPPTLVDTETSSSAEPLLRMSREPTVVWPAAAGCSTYAPLVTMPGPPAWLSGAEHPALATAIAAATLTNPMTRLNLSTRNNLPLVDRGSDQAQRRGAEVHQRGVEALEREARPPGRPGPVAQRHDLQLSPGVAAVGRVEGRPPGLGERRRAGQVGVGLEPRGRLLHGHARRVHPERAGQPGHPDQGLEPDAEREPRVVGQEPLLDAELLGVVRPALHEGAREQRPPDGAAGPAQRLVMREVPRRDLVHSDGRQGGGAEHLEPLLGLLLRPRLVRRGDPGPGRGAAPGR